jgi:hypothetical protein
LPIGQLLKKRVFCEGMIIESFKKKQFPVPLLGKSLTLVFVGALSLAVSWLTGCNNANLSPTSTSLTAQSQIQDPTATPTCSATSTATATATSTPIVLSNISQNGIVILNSNNNYILTGGYGGNGGNAILNGAAVSIDSSYLNVAGGTGNYSSPVSAGCGGNATLSLGTTLTLTTSYPITANDGASATLINSGSLTINSGSLTISGQNAVGPGGNGGNANVSIGGNLVITSDTATPSPVATP